MTIDRRRFLIGSFALAVAGKPAVQVTPGEAAAITFEHQSTVTIRYFWKTLAGTEVFDDFRVERIAPTGTKRPTALEVVESALAMADNVAQHTDQLLRDTSGDYLDANRAALFDQARRLMRETVRFEVVKVDVS